MADTNTTDIQHAFSDEELGKIWSNVSNWARENPAMAVVAGIAAYWILIGNPLDLFKHKKRR